jgi:hypothetical protein
MTPAERDAYAQSIRAKSKTYGKPAPPVTVPAPVPGATEANRQARQAVSLPTDVSELKRAEDELRKELTLRQRARAVGPVADEEIARQVDEEMNRRKQPMYVGSFAGATTPYTSVDRPGVNTAVGSVKTVLAPGLPIVAGMKPSLYPENAPIAPGVSLFEETMRPQIRAPKAVEEPFDAVEFEKSIKDLPTAEQQAERSNFSGMRAAYKRIRDLNPSMNSEDIFNDMSRQLKGLGPQLQGKGPTITQDPATMGKDAGVSVSQDPLSLALSRQTTAGSVPNLEPGQMAFLKAKNDIDLGLRQAEDRAALRKQTFTPAASGGGDGDGRRGAVAPTPRAAARPYTEKEIDDLITNKTNSGAYGTLDWWADEEKKNAILSSPDRFVKGGVLFQTEYPTGATVESPTMYGLRSAMTLINAATGAAGYAFTPDIVQEKKSAGRPEKFKGTGLYENVLYNVAKGGGLTQEIGDLYKYNPDTDMQKYEIVGQVAGFAGDLLSLGDLAVGAGAIGGAKAGISAARATKAVEGAVDLAAVGKYAFKGAASSYVDAIPGLSKLATKLAPGDVRLVYGGKLSQEMEAASLYKTVYDADKTPRSIFETGAKPAADVEFEAFRAHSAAEDAVRAEFPNTKFARDLGEEGDRMRGILDGNYFSKGQKAFNEADAVAQAAAKLGKAPLTTAEELLLKPYLAAAARSDPKITAGLVEAFKGAEKNRVTASAIAGQLGQGEALNRFSGALRKSAAFEAGVKTVDTGLSEVMQRGGAVVIVTPRTLATPANAEKLAAKYQTTDFFTKAVKPLQEAGRVELQIAGKVEQGFEVTPEIAAQLTAAANEARVSGHITNAVHTQVLDNIGSGVITAADIRTLAYDQLDTLALAEQKGVQSRALAEVGKPAEGRGLGPTRATTIAQQRRAEELTSDLPLMFRRTTNELLDSADRLGPIISPVQKQIIADARGKVSALDRTLRDDYRRLGKDAAFAESYGIRPDASSTEKIIALGQGTTNSAGGKAYATALIDSLIYGSKDQSPWVRAFSGQYLYGEQILSSTREYTALIDKLADMTPQRLAESLDDVFAEVQKMVSTTVNTRITDAGGRVLAVPKTLKSEALAVAYARTRANEIIADAAVKLIPERPMALTDLSRTIIDELTRLAGGKNEGLKFFYDMVKKEAAAPGYWDDLIKRTFVDGDPVLGPALDDLISKTTSLDPEIAAKFSRALENRLGAEFKGDAPAGLLEDVTTHVDLMKSEGLLADNRIDEAMQRVDDLYTGKMDASKLALPAIAERIKADLGSEAKYSQLLKELAKLSDIAHDGNISAGRAVRVVRQMINAYHSFYYYSILSLAPAFHGVNNLTAPAIAYFTTGRLSNPLRTPEAANILLLGARYADPAKRLVPVVTDALGNVYTRGDLYDLALRSGVFRSQLEANVSSDFINEANKLMGTEGKLTKGFQARRALTTLPRELLADPIATWTDNMWRMESVTGALRNGKTIEEALSVGKKSLFDYGTLTPLEQDISRNFFVFYNYFRQSVVQFMRNAVANPERITRMIRATTQPSRIAIGDQNYNDLSFYAPPELGTTRIVGRYDTASSNKIGSSMLLPMMPDADALSIAGTLFTDPIAFLAGPTAEGRGRVFTEGVVAKRLGPASKIVGATLFSENPVDDLLEVKLPQNRLMPEHIALLMTANEAAGTAFLNHFNAKVVDASPSENAYKGKAFVVSDEDFARYKLYINAVQVGGVSRIWGDYGKIAGGSNLTGAYPEGILEQMADAIGAAKFKGAEMPEAVQRKAIQSRTTATQKEASELKKDRQPKREIDKRK